MAGSVVKKENNTIKKIDVFNSPEFKSLPVEKQLELAQKIAENNIELNAEQERYLREHLSSNTDTNEYLNFLDEQNTILANSKGVNMTYNSYETQTPTGKISSKTTHASASTGCLLPILVTLAFVVALISL